MPCPPAGQDDHELVAAGAVDAAVDTDDFAKAVGDLPDLQVARRMTATVVDRLQPVEVDGEQRERLRGLGSTRDRQTEVVLEGAAIPEARQRVGASLCRELVDASLVRALDATAVASHHPEEEERPLDRSERRGTDLDVDEEPLARPVLQGIGALGRRVRS